MSDEHEKKSHEEIVEFLNGESVIPTDLKVLSEAGYVDEDPVRTTVRRNFGIDISPRDVPKDPPFYDSTTGEYDQAFIKFNSDFLFELYERIEAGTGLDLDYKSLNYERGEDTKILEGSSITVTLRATFDAIREGKAHWNVDYHAFVLR